MNTKLTQNLSIVLPAKNEAQSLVSLLPQLRAKFPEAQILVVDDGSTDDTVAVCESSQVEVVSHRYSQGNGAAVKTGIRHACSDILVLMDADGQHRPEAIDSLLERLSQGYDMVVGARNKASQASLARLLGNAFYNQLASWMVSHTVLDLTSGFRAVRREKILEFLYLMPNGFSYPTTVTMAFFRAGYAISYVPIVAPERIGKSHINVWKDGVKFLLIIFKIGTLYSPLKIFTPISLFFFMLGVGYYSYTFVNFSRFTNMSALLLVTAVLIFLMGLISEQIANLVFKRDS